MTDFSVCGVSGGGISAASSSRSTAYPAVFTGFGNAGNVHAAPSWSEALHEFLIHVQATRAPKTHLYYKGQLGLLVRWAEAEQVPFEHFGKRHLDRYLVARQNEGKAQLTLHHAAICAKAFMAWCSRNDLLERSLLADYQVRNAPKPAKYMPTEEDMRKLLLAVFEYWDVAKNPDVRYNPPAKRFFHRDRNYAIFLGLLDTACRIGEMLNFKVEDYQEKERQITVRVSKGREPRAIPVSEEWAAALSVWLRCRARVMRNVPPAEDQGWLFISETGCRLDECRVLKTLKNYGQFAGTSDKITLHSLRRFSLNKLAKTNLLMAQIIAGHKETKTTLIYTQIDPDFVRAAHATAGVAKGVVQSKEIAAKRKRLI